jgi:ATP-binding cassette subfamily F protein 3
MILNSLVKRLIVFDDNRVSVFEGTYDEFLRRVGWKSEGNVTVEKPALSERGCGIDRKEARRLKAGIITARGRVLGALQKNIETAESEIVGLEKLMERDTAGLVKASEKGEWQAIAALSKSLHEARERIDVLFAELETFTSEYVDQAKSFEEQLAPYIQY